MSHPGAHRNKGSQTRSHPYNRTQFQGGRPNSEWYNQEAPPAGNSEGTWKHDLFTPLSDIYTPSPNVSFANPEPQAQSAPSSSRFVAPVNPSLKPWGSLTPASSFGATPSVPAPVQQIPTAPAQKRKEAPPPRFAKQSLSLFDRVSESARSASLLDRLSASLNDPSAIERPSSAPPTAKKRVLEQSKQRTKAPPRGPAAASRPVLQTAVSAGPWGDPSGDGGMDVDMDDEPRAVEKPKGTIVRVANLIEGTSAEDVETAFAGFGGIYSAKIVERKNGLLTAEINYEEEAAAKRAAIELDGQIADGQALSVKVIVQPAPAPVVKAAPSKAAPAPVRTIPTGPKSRAPPARPAQPGQAQSSNLFARMGLAHGSSQAPTGPAQRQPSRPTPVASTSAPAQPVGFSQAPNGMQMGIPESSSALRSERIAQMDPRASFQSQPFVTPGAQTADYEEEQRRIKTEEEAEARARRQEEQRGNRRNQGRGRGRSNQSRSMDRPSQPAPAPAPQLTLAQRLGISS